MSTQVRWTKDHLHDAVTEARAEYKRVCRDRSGDTPARGKAWRAYMEALTALGQHRLQEDANR